MFRLRRTIAASAFPIRKLSINIYPGGFLNADDVTTRVVDVVKSVKFAPEKVDLSAALGTDLKFDSFLRKDLYAKLEKEFCVKIPSKITEDLVTVRAIVDYFSTHPKAR
jgi:acyl carrier protein